MPTGAGLLAHGVGSRGDLPLPLWQFAWAAMAALIISFMALGVLWQQPRLAAAAEGRGISLGPIGRVAGAVARLVGLAMYVLVLAAAFFGIDQSRINIAPVAIYVVFWVGLAVAAASVFNVWEAINPFDTIGIVSESL